MYFKYFPKIAYQFQIGNELKLLAVQDVALNVRVKKEIFDRITLYDEYDIEDGETFDIISDKLYGSPNYHWTIMLMNLRFDYRKDIVLTDLQLESYINSKYTIDSVKFSSDYSVDASLNLDDIYEADVSTVSSDASFTQHEMFGQLHYENNQGLVLSKLSEDQWKLINPYSSYAEYQQTLIADIPYIPPINTANVDESEPMYLIYSIGQMYAYTNLDNEFYIPPINTANVDESEPMYLIYSIGQMYAYTNLDNEFYIASRDQEIANRLKNGMDYYSYRQRYKHDTYEEYTRQFITISNKEYESKLNEEKRRIKVINPSLLPQVVKEVKELIQNV